MIDFRDLSDNEAGRRQAFEALTQAIALEVDRAEPVDGSGGDFGLDSFLGVIGGEIIAYQAKYFEGRLNSKRRKQVESSLERAVGCHSDLLKWTLAIPIDFNVHEHKWWQNIKNENPNLEMGLWHKTKIENLLRLPQCDGIRREYLPSLEDRLRESTTQLSSEHSEIKEATGESRARIEHFFSDQKEALAGIIERLPASEESIKSVRREDLHRRLDQARDIIRKGNARTAFELFEEILSDEHLDDHLHFRVHTGIAACHMKFGDESRAEEHFGLAHSHLPEEPKGLANLAFLHLLRGSIGDGQPLIDKAYELDPNHVDVVSIKAQYHMANSEYSEAEGLFNAELLQNQTCKFALAKVYENAGKERAG